MATKKEKDLLKVFRKQVKNLVHKQTFDDFCLNCADIQKSTMSRLLSGERTEFRFTNLKEVANALGKELVIRLE